MMLKPHTVMAHAENIAISKSKESTNGFSEEKVSKGSPTNVLNGRPIRTANRMIRRIDNNTTPKNGSKYLIPLFN